MKRAELEKYRKALDEVVRLAQDDLKKAFDLLVGSGIPAEQVRDGLVEATFGIASTYGDVAATASAEWYEALRPSRLGEYQAVLGKTVSYGEIEGSVRYAAGHLFEGDPQQTLNVLNGSLQRFVESPARDTIHKNALRDPSKPRWARVPSGGKTCAWCFMLCSRGFVYKTEVSAGGVGNKFHDDDRCMIVPGWGTNPTIEGYDPEAMYDLYQKVWSPGDTDRDVARKLRATYPDMFSDGVQTSKPGVTPAGLSRIPPEDAWTATLAVNPKYLEDRAYQINCARCSTAWELRRQGWEAFAGPGSLRVPAGERQILNTEWAVNQWTRRITGEKVTLTGRGAHSTTIREMEQTLPDGAHGVIRASWKDTRGGHVWNWEKQDGAIVFFDAQTGKQVPQQLYLSRAKRGSLMWARLDDADPTGNISHVLG